MKNLWKKNTGKRHKCNSGSKGIRYKGPTQYYLKILGEKLLFNISPDVPIGDKLFFNVNYRSKCYFIINFLTIYLRNERKNEIMH